MVITFYKDHKQLVQPCPKLVKHLNLNKIFQKQTVLDQIHLHLQVLHIYNNLQFTIQLILMIPQILKLLGLLGII